MNTNTYPITNNDLRADWERTNKQAFAGIAHTGTIEQTDRIWVPAHTEITVDFGSRLGVLKFKMGDTPAWSDIVVASIRKSASYRQKMAERKTKAEPVITYTGRALKRPERPKLEGKYPTHLQPRPGMA